MVLREHRVFDKFAPNGADKPPIIVHTGYRASHRQYTENGIYRIQRTRQTEHREWYLQDTEHHRDRVQRIVFTGYIASHRQDTENGICRIQRIMPTGYREWYL
jgi:hypothetical protein